MSGALHRAIAKSGALAPRALLKAGLSAAFRSGLHLSLCLHRVGRPGAASWFPEYTMPAEELRALLELLVEAGPASERWLTVAFDDGYLDAVEWVDGNAARFAGVDFVLAVCSAKVERRLGFAWDLAAREVARGRPAAQARAWVEAGERGERAVQELLAGVADLPDSRLATLRDLHEVRRHPNVELGNHTDDHLELGRVAPEVARDALSRSAETFARLFGAERHFAFPYGVVGRSFRRTEVDALRAAGPGRTLWSTQSRPFRPGGGLAVLPRLALDGRWRHRALAALIAERAGVEHLRELGRAG